MSVEVKRVSTGEGPSTLGTLTVVRVSPQRVEVRFTMQNGATRVYSSDLGGADDLEVAVQWAVRWAAGRRIPCVYVQTDDGGDVAP